MKYFLIISILLSVGCGFHYSEGERTGYITKISKKGFFAKTWEGQLRVGGMQNGQGTMETETWEFTVINDKIAEAVSKAMKLGNKVTLKYDQKIYFFTFPQGDTSHFIIEVEEN